MRDLKNLQAEKTACTAFKDVNACQPRTMVDTNVRQPWAIAPNTGAKNETTAAQAVDTALRTVFHALPRRAATLANACRAWNPESPGVLMSSAVSLLRCDESADVLGSSFSSESSSESPVVLLLSADELVKSTDPSGLNTAPIGGAVFVAGCLGAVSEVLSLVSTVSCSVSVSELVGEVPCCAGVWCV